MKLDQLIGKIANKEFKLYKFSREFRTEYFIFWGLKILTMLISIWAAYNIVFQKSLLFFGNEKYAQIFTITFLILIEFGGYKSLNTIFKYALRKKITNLAFPLTIALILLTFSFFATINGMALRQFHNANNTKKINNTISQKKDSIKKSYNKRIERLKEAIIDVKENPDSYDSGDTAPSMLSSKLTGMIKNYNNQILDVESKRDSILTKLDKKEKKLVKNETRKAHIKATEYKKYAIIIMIAQLITNFILSYANKQTYQEEDKTKVINENIRETRTQMMADFMKHFASDLATVEGQVKHALLQQNKEPEEEIQTVFGKINDEFIDQPQEKKNPIIKGFRTNDDDNNTNPNTTSNNNTNSHSNTSSNASSNTSSNANQQTQSQQIDKKLLGKLKTNEMLRVALEKQAQERANLKNYDKPTWTENRIIKETGVKRWRVYEFKNLMVSAGLLPENYLKK